MIACNPDRIMVRLSRLSDYAVVVLMRLSERASVQTAACLAASTGIPEPTVAKVLKLLAASGLAESLRGARGGYRLARGLGEITVADVIGAIDGPIALTACVEGAPVACDVGLSCAMRGRWTVVNDAIREALSGISLAAMQPPRAVPHPAVPAAAEA